jgi:lysozyme
MSNLLVEWLKFEEGFRARPYRDSVGVLTVGYGRNLVAHPLPPRNWSAEPCTEAEAEGWLRTALADLYFRLRARKPIIESIDPVRSACLLNMAYQLGVAGVLVFPRMWAAIEERSWMEAALMAEDSRWAKQTPNRARRVCQALESGEWPQEIIRG